MKILILTQYFPPEVGAPQNRLFELALRLRAKGLEVTILTAMPNYPAMEIHSSYRGKRMLKESINDLTVFRSSIFVSKSRKLVPRLLNYFSFVFSSMFTGIVRIPKHDFVLCESPPLFLGISALFICFFKRSKLIFNVSDLWPESAEKLGVVTNKFLLKLSYWLESKLYRSSVLITGQTQGICENIRQRFPSKDVYWLPNGVDLDYYKPLPANSGWRTENGFEENDIIFLYGGIIGLAQGLEVILKAANALKGRDNLKFVLLGAGPEKERLEKLSKELGLNNLFFLPPVGKDKMPAIVSSCNASIIPLRKLDIFLGAIPSKIFEVIAMEKPILLGVDGEARKLFIEEGKCGMYFEPENFQSLVNAIEALISAPGRMEQLGKNGRLYANQKFNRDKIASGFYEKLQTIKP